MSAIWLSSVAPGLEICSRAAVDVHSWLGGGRSGDDEVRSRVLPVLCRGSYRSRAVGFGGERVHGLLGGAGLRSSIHLLARSGLRVPGRWHSLLVEQGCSAEVASRRASRMLVAPKQPIPRHEAHVALASLQHVLSFLCAVCMLGSAKLFACEDESQEWIAGTVLWRGERMC